MNKKIVIFINSLDGVISTLLNNLVEKYECHLMENKISYELDSRINIISLDEKWNS